MTPWEAFKKEFMFSLDIRITEKKIVNPHESSSSESIAESGSSTSTSSNKTNKSKTKSMASSLRHRDHLVINNENLSAKQFEQN